MSPARWEPPGESYPAELSSSVGSGKVDEKQIRENNKHLVHRPFTSNHNEQIDKPQKHEDTFGSKIEQKTSCDYPEKYCKVGANDDIVDRANKRITRLRRKAGA